MKLTDLLDDVVRMVVTLMFAGASVYGFLYDKIGAEAFLGMAGLAIGFWFRGQASNGSKA